MTGRWLAFPPDIRGQAEAGSRLRRDRPRHPPLEGLMQPAGAPSALLCAAAGPWGTQWGQLDRRGKPLEPPGSARNLAGECCGSYP